VNAQVRIGGIDDPNPSAVLDLNATDATEDGTLGLLLPRVRLTSTTDVTTIKNPVAGLMVYNTLPAGNGTTAVVAGVYYYDGNKWMLITVPEVDWVIGNEVTDATTGGGLVRAGLGTNAAPWTLGIATGGVTSTHIADGAVALADLASNSVNSAKIVDESITSADILNATIALADLADNSVNSAKIVNESIASADILDGTIALADLASNSVNSAKIVDGSIASADILDGTIALADLASNSVNSSKIVDLSIATADLADRSVTAAKLNQMGASTQNAMVWNGSTWVPAYLPKFYYTWVELATPDMGDGAFKKYAWTVPDGFEYGHCFAYIGDYAYRRLAYATYNGIYIWNWGNTNYATTTVQIRCIR
jgi:hypothetical protein